MPSLTSLINFLTKFYYPYRNKLLGKLLRVDTRTILFGKDIKFFNYMQLRFGKHILINSGFEIIGNGKITIEDFTYTAPNVTIITTSHNKENMEEILNDVKIKKMCWIGANVTIFPGVTINEGSIIGAGSIVSKDIPAYSIAYGNPIKIVANRKIAYPYRLPGGKFYLLENDSIVSSLYV